MGKFKQWLEFGGGGGAATTAMHGGLSAFDRGNVNMNVRSKTQTQDGRVGHDAERMEVPPERLFGLKKKSDRKRPTKDIDSRRSGVVRDNRPNIVY